MSDTDSFIQEVSEELKRDRMLALWRRYGAFVIGAVILVVVAAAAMTWQQQQRVAAARAVGGALISAAEAPDPAARAEAFAAIAASAKPGPALIARLSQAGALVEAGDREGAARIYDLVAQDGAQDPIYRDVAGFKALMLRAEDMAPADRAAALAPFAAEGAPLRLLALEARAVALLEAGDAAGARADLDAVLSDPRSTAEMRQRAGALAEAFGPRAGDDA